jgi:hypothetical protein
MGLVSLWEDPASSSLLLPHSQSSVPKERSCGNVARRQAREESSYYKPNPLDRDLGLSTSRLWENKSHFFKPTRWYFIAPTLAGKAKLRCTVMEDECWCNLPLWYKWPVSVRNPDSCWLSNLCQRRFFFLVVLGVEPRALSMLEKHSYHWSHMTVLWTTGLGV